MFLFSVPINKNSEKMIRFNKVLTATDYFGNFNLTNKLDFVIFYYISYIE